MRVLIDASALLLRSAGVKTYFYHWLAALREVAPKGEIDAFPFLGELGALAHERSVLPAWATLPRLAALYFINVPGNPAMDRLVARYDVVHLSNQVRVGVRSTRLTATVHDLTALLMPELHTPGNVKADAGFAWQTCRRADGLIAVSESTRADVVRVLGLDPGRVEVIHPGVDGTYFEARADGETKARYGLSRPYALFVGTIEPRKNLGVLLEAWSGLRPDTREEFELVVAGPVGWESENTLARLRAAPAGVRYLGYVPEADLPALTAGASAFVYPSLYEGFGLPVAQAMAAGVAVITSNVSSLPEVAGDAAMLVDPRSVSELRAALESLIESAPLRAQLGARGRERARRFRWDECARKSLEFFRKVVGRDASR